MGFLVTLPLLACLFLWCSPVAASLFRTTSSLSPRQTTSDFNFTFTPGTWIYRQAAGYNCPSLSFAVEGLAPPFSIDAMRLAPLGTQLIVLEHIANLTNSGDSTVWNVTLAAGQRVTFRAMDRNGLSLYTPPRSVSDGGWGDCKKINGTWWDNLGVGQYFFVIGMIVLGVLVLFLYCCGPCLLSRSKRAAFQPAATGGIELAATSHTLGGVARPQQAHIGRDRHKEEATEKGEKKSGSGKTVEAGLSLFDLF
ncbi:hypothetical protein JCM10207_001222 [Rhodosporidiobolus poonsookiae]